MLARYRGTYLQYHHPRRRRREIRNLRPAWVMEQNCVSKKKSVSFMLGIMAHICNLHLGRRRQLHSKFTVSLGYIHRNTTQREPCYLGAVRGT